jgi:hypothetical protein
MGESRPWQVLFQRHHRFAVFGQGRAKRVKKREREKRERKREEKREEER